MTISGTSSKTSYILDHLVSISSGRPSQSNFCHTSPSALPMSSTLFRNSQLVALLSSRSITSAGTSSPSFKAEYRSSIMQCTISCSVESRLATVNTSSPTTSMIRFGPHQLNANFWPLLFGWLTRIKWPFYNLGVTMFFRLLDFLNCVFPVLCVTFGLLFVHHIYSQTESSQYVPAVLFGRVPAE